MERNKPKNTFVPSDTEVYSHPHHPPPRSQSLSKIKKSSNFCLLLSLLTLRSGEALHFTFLLQKTLTGWHTDTHQLLLLCRECMKPWPSAGTLGMKGLHKTRPGSALRQGRRLHCSACHPLPATLFFTSTCIPWQVHGRHDRGFDQHKHWHIYIKK